MSGLQRELGRTLESLDDANDRSRGDRESANNLKRELRNASRQVKELKAEAEARDRLIESFASILLKKIDTGSEGGIVGLGLMENEEMVCADGSSREAIC